MPNIAGVRLRPDEMAFLQRVKELVGRGRSQQSRISSEARRRQRKTGVTT